MTSAASTSKFPRQVGAIGDGNTATRGKEKRLALGVYPEISLKDARLRRDEARKLLSTRVDPLQQRKKEKLLQAEQSGETFEKVGREWYGRQAEVWSPDHAKRVLSRLERDIFPFLRDRPVAGIEAPELVSVFRRIEARGVRETVHRAKQDCEAIFAFAIAAGKCKHNPAAGVRRALAPKPKTAHFAAVTEPEQFGELLRKIDSFEGTFIVLCALRLAPHLPVRPGELRKAKWQDIDFDKAECRLALVSKRWWIASDPQDIAELGYVIRGNRRSASKGQPHREGGWEPAALRILLQGESHIGGMARWHCRRTGRRSLQRRAYCSDSGRRLVI